MKSSYWAYWLILLGVFIIGVMMLVNSATTGSTQDYYMLKEVTQASMIDAIDYSYYRLYGDVRMSEQKFAENFIRRFAESTTLAKNYTVEFYDIHEVPPKVSVKVSSVSSSFNIANTSNNAAEIVDTIDIILIGGVGNGTGTTGGSESICCLHFDDAFKNYIISNDVSNYSYLQDWKNDRANGKDGNFREAISKQFPWITSQKSINGLSSQLNSEPFFKEAVANNWVYIINNTTSCS